MRKKTKIVATISDLKCDVDFLKKLYDHGMNVVRINTAHASFEGAKKVIKNVRQVSEKIALLVDTKGPEIRTRPLEEGIRVVTGELVKLGGSRDGISSKDLILVNYDQFVQDVPEKSKILIDDGDLELFVEEKHAGYLTCRVMNSGIIKGKKSINIPSADIQLPSISKKDIEFIQFAVEQDLDFIAHSFVRRKEDIQAVQDVLNEYNSEIKIIAKIENEDGVKNIDEILDIAYGVMVARGDLAIEISPEKLPLVQKQIIKKAIHKRRPVIVATQMLQTMIENPRPTRAEVSDVANAIYDGTDAIMLSGETAYGKYPIEAVKMMKSIAKEVEGNTLTFQSGLQAVALARKTTKAINQNDKIAAQLTKVALDASENLDVKAIISDTTSGRSIRALAAYRSRHTIYAQCYSKHTMRKLTLSYGVHVDFLEKPKSHSAFIKNALNNLIHKKAFNQDNLVTVIAGNYGRAIGVSYIEIASVKNLIGNK
ncbi:MAG: pyruvate kinase [Bacteroidales bacterium]|nr:pyruvate kinase [Bacteroidales bacterium]